MKKTILTLLVFAACFMGCKKDEEAQSQSQFKGSYVGSYVGGDTGTLSVDVDGAGNIKGSSVSSKTHEVFSMTGAVDVNGTFTGTTEIGTSFTGTFTSSSAKGSWNNTSLNLSGTWTGNKQ